MLKRALCCAALLVLTATSAWAAPPSPVVVLPLSVEPGGPEWLGSALADAMWLRLHAQTNVATHSPRQARAAMQQVGLNDALLSRPTAASLLATQLGAAALITGNIRPRKKLVVSLRRVDPHSGRPIGRKLITGSLNDLIALERAVAGAVWELLELSESPAPEGLGTTQAQAWQTTAEAMPLLRKQSLSPPAADPSLPFALSSQELARLRQLASRASKADPSYIRPKILLAAADFFAGNTVAAEKALQALPAQQDPLLPLVSAFVQMRSGRFDDAESSLRSAIEHKPGFLHARGSLGQLLVRFGRFREARAAFESYAQVAPNNPWVQAQIAYTEAKLGQVAQAVERTERAVELSPDSAFLWIELASRHLDADQVPQAEVALHNAIKLDPTAAVAYVRLGYVHLLQGNSGASAEVSEKALAQIGRPTTTREKRDAAYAHLNLGVACGRQGMLDAAFDHLNQARRLGLEDFAELAKDPQLAELRRDERYRAFVD